MARDTRKSVELWEKYGQHLLMAVPYADSLIAHANGCFLTDLDGNRILDLAAGQLCSTLGSNHPKYIQRITEQLSRVMHTGSQFGSPILLEAAAKLAEIAPGKLNKSIFLSTGTEANECALSLAKAYTGKRGVIGFNRGYYGLSLGTKSLTSIFSDGDRHGSGPTVPESFRFLAPHCFHCPVKNKYPECNFVCLEGSIEALPRHRDLAAIIVEPVFSAGGLFIPPPGYLKLLREFADEIGALLIVDEAQTGFGRTGKWFACEHHEIEPDILVISKSAGAGFPVSAVITNDEIANECAARGWQHLASHQSDPLPAAAVAATIDIVREEGLVEKAAENGSYFLERLRSLKSKYPAVVDVRGLGLMIGLEIGKNGTTSEHELCALIVALCEARGVHLTYTYFEPVIRFVPSLTIGRSEIDLAVSVVDDAIGTAVKGDVRLEDVLPSNRYTRAFIEGLRDGKSLKAVAARLFETSPKYWLEKLKERASR